MAFAGQEASAAAEATDQPQPPAQGLSKGLDPGSTIDLDLGRGRFLDPLPFDVQFYVRSEIADNTTRVSGRYAQRSRDQDCAAALTAGAAGMGAGRLLRGTPRRVELSVPALPPNRQFCFEFTLTLKPDETRLRAIVAEQLDLQLRALYLSEGAINANTAFDQFRAALLSSIRDAARQLELETGMELRLTVPNDSFFADPPSAGDERPEIVERPGTPATAIALKERQAFDAVLQNQLGKGNAITAFTTTASAAAAALNTLRGMPAFGRIIAQLRANAAQPLVALRLPSDSPLRFADASADFDVALAAGFPTGQLSGIFNPANVWNSADLAANLSNLDTTIRQLDEFRGIVLQLAALPPLQEAAGLGPLVNGTANPNAVSGPQLSAVADQVAVIRENLAETRGALGVFGRALDDRTAGIAAMAARVTADLIEVIEIDGTTTAAWETRARSYVSADIGVAWSDPIDSFFFYVGANFYLGPVNKKAPLRWSDPGNFRKRFAFVAGVPINPFKQTAVTQLDAGGVTLKGVIGNRPLLLGAGLRLTDLIRSTGGVVLFNVKSPNPLIAGDRVDYAWFMAFSIDWDLRTTFAELRSTPQSNSSARRP